MPLAVPKVRLGSDLTSRQREVLALLAQDVGTDTMIPPGQTGLLSVEFFQDGEWDAQWVTKPVASGKAVVPIDPYCASDGTYKYCLKMPGMTASFEISYWDR